ncbi:Rv1733c family protein [Streptomyces corynorhini]|uniref:Integral membrane protein n=1 Tax=Streptomyces corynorhini TaxID=2282652 RepID=A0A370B9C4_9ACTN|nr:hypothetical protein [Streptomyces corynorhini]RDG36025.1 hypothetical protein DVH02_22270 [Streptomyces corynorhini]
MRTIVGLRRWRHNPLCRRTDLVEAWLALTAAVLIALAAPAVGLLCGRAVDATLRETVRLQHEQRHRTEAEVIALSAERVPLVYDVESPVGQDLGGRVVATWRAPDGSTRTDTLSAPLRDPHPGDTFVFWTDRHGDEAQAPMTATAARAHAVFAGLGSAVPAVVLVECGRRLAVWRLVQRRYERLDRAWARAGPDWGRTGAGS